MLMLKFSFMLNVLLLICGIYFLCILRNLWEFIKEYVGLKETDKYSEVAEQNDL